MKPIMNIKKKIFYLSGFWIGSRYIYRELIFPFLFSISVVTFILLVNYLIKAVDRLLGKGLSFSIIIEFIYLNLAWIVAMSIPMSVLVACIMAYGRMSEDNEITALRSSGISFISILSPGIMFGLVITLFSLYFQNNVLPDFNHRSRLLSGDIYRKRPDLNLEPGFFMDDLPNYSIYTKKKVGERLEDVVIFSKNSAKTQTTIYADSGRLNIIGDKIRFTLFTGEIHELTVDKMEEYSKLNFERHVITIPVDDMLLKRRDNSRRGDREMNIKMMRQKQAKYTKEKNKVQLKILKLAEKQFPNQNIPNDHKKIKKLIENKITTMSNDTSINKTKEIRKLKALQNRIKGESNLLLSYQKQVNKYGVEIQKKLAMPFACLIFVLIGAPLGVMNRRGGVTTAAVYSILFFLIYYVFLVGGEELGNMAIISPFWAMWTSNIILFFIGLYLIYVATWEQKPFSGIMQKVKKIKKRKKGL